MLQQTRRRNRSDAIGRKVMACLILSLDEGQSEAPATLKLVLEARKERTATLLRKKAQPARPIQPDHFG